MHWIILLFCFTIGFAALYYGLKSLRLRGRVKRWELVKATVNDKKIIDKKLASATSAGSRANKRISINYSYNFNVQHYQGNRVFFVELLKGERNFSLEDAENF